MSGAAMAPPRPEFSRPVAVDRLGPAEKTYTIEATVEERVALAERFAILSVERLVAVLRLRTQAGGDRVRLRGRFEAAVTQACVVTLEPVPALLAEAFELYYAAAAEQAGEGGEVEIAFDAEDPPEPILDGRIDLGEAVAEHLALALEPFPRLPGVAFAPPPDLLPPGVSVGEEAAESLPEEPVEDSAEDTVRPNPFAVLAALRKK